MKGIVFSEKKQGNIVVYIRNIEMNEDGKILAEWKLEGKKGGVNTQNEGYYYNAEFVQSKIKGNYFENSIQSFRLKEAEDWILKHMDDLRRERDEKIQAKLAEAKKELEQKGTVYFLFIGGDTGRRYIGTGFFDKEEAKRRNYKDEYAEKMIFRNFATEWHQLEREVNTATIEGQRGHIDGLYGTVIIITEKQYEELLKMNEMSKEKQREQAEQKEKEKREKFEEAKRTGKPVLLCSWPEECNDDKECDVDIVETFAMPDGTTKTERTHTY